MTFENGRQRQDVWSKKTWEAPEPGAGAGEPVVLTAEQTENGGADKLHNFIGKIIPKKDLTILSEDDKIKLDKAYEYLSTVFANVDKNVHKLNPQLIIENAEQLKKLNARFGAERSLAHWQQEPQRRQACHTRRNAVPFQSRQGRRG